MWLPLFNETNGYGGEPLKQFSGKHLTKSYSPKRTKSLRYHQAQDDKQALDWRRQFLHATQYSLPYFLRRKAYRQIRAWDLRQIRFHIPRWFR